jgi:hypothetical protein
VPEIAGVSVPVCVRVGDIVAVGEAGITAVLVCVADKAVYKTVAVAALWVGTGADGDVMLFFLPQPAKTRTNTANKNNGTALNFMRIQPPGIVSIQIIAALSGVVKVPRTG